MATISIQKTTWDLALGGLGWSGPVGDTLWENFGGGARQDLNWEMVYLTVMSVGWTQQHAEVLWKTLAAYSVPVPPEPSVVQPDPSFQPQPADQIAQIATQNEAPIAPWERQPTEDPLEEPQPKAKKSKKPAKEKAAKAKAPKEKREFKKPEMGLVSKRLLAAVIDGAVVVVFGFIAATAIGIGPTDMLGKASANVDITNVLLAGLLMSALSGAYFVLLMKRPDRLGQSLGKQILGVRVVRQDTDPVDPRTIIMRQVVGVVLLPWLVLWQANNLMYPLGYLALAVLLLLSLRGRGIPDLVASTEVVEE